MPKEPIKDFKPANMGEARSSILRDFKRDAASVQHDTEILKFLAEEQAFKNATPTVKSLQLGRRKGSPAKKGRSTKEVAFAPDSRLGTPRRMDSPDQRRLE